MCREDFILPRYPALLWNRFLSNSLKTAFFFIFLYFCYFIGLRFYFL